MSNQHRTFKPDFDIVEIQQTESGNEAHFDSMSPESNAHIPPSDDSTESLIPLQQISLEVVIKFLIEKGVFSHKELSDYEFALRRNTDSSEAFEITPRQRSNNKTEAHIVRTHSKRVKKQVKHKYLRKVLSRHKWGRRIGTLLFGWKWRRKGTNDGDGILIG